MSVAAFLRLLLNGKSGIINTAVFEEFLIDILHFNNKFFTLLILTIKVKNGLTIRIGLALTFVV